jgi:glycosyltransferase involved in cell wall biosynthesis
MLEQAEEDAWNEYLADYSEEEQDEIRDFGFTLRERWTEFEYRDARDQARRRTLDVVVQAAQDQSGSASPIQLVSVVTGRPGEFGGLNTASDIILRGLGAGAGITPIALVVPGAGPLPPSMTQDADGVEFVALGSTKQYKLMRRKIPTWVFGHGIATGALAKAIADDWKFRRVHFVHVDPHQIEMARRSTMADSANARRKAIAELDLLASADLRVFIGNASQAYPSLASKATSISDFALGSAPADSVTTPGREPIKIMMFGRLDDAEVKGVDVMDGLIHDGDLLRWRAADGARVEFMAIGAGENDPRAESWAGRCSVHPMLSRHEIHDLFLPQASVVIHPSNADSFGLSAIESLAVGRPTLVSETAGVASLYRKFGRSDWVLPGRQEADPAMWSDRIKGLVETQAQWNEASDQATELTKAIAGRSDADVKHLISMLQAVPPDPSV